MYSEGGDRGWAAPSAGLWRQTVLYFVLPYTRVWSTTSPRVGHRSGGILVVLQCGTAGFEAAIGYEACVWPVRGQYHKGSDTAVFLCVFFFVEHLLRGTHPAVV